MRKFLSLKKTNKTLFLILIIFFSINLNYSQVGINTTTPQGMLDINSNNQGVVFPKVQLTDATVEAPVINPNGGTLTIGTLVYNTNTAGVSPNNVTPGYYYWSGTKWTMLSSEFKNIYNSDGSINELRSINLTNKINFDNNTLVVDGINNKIGIGTNDINSRAALQINSINNDTGILIPRLTLSQRNAMIMTNAEDGVMIFNTDEDCFNYWNKNSTSWKSICGDKNKAIFTISCSTTNQAYGNYVVNQPVTNENYINLIVNVTTPGNYTIYGTTTNGYNFSTSGEFIATGNYTIKLNAQGTPIVAQTNIVTFTDGNLPLSCANPTSITVLPKSNFTINCSTITVNGQYKVGQPLINSNTITIPVNVTSLGYYSVTSNNVDGISFNKFGSFTSLGAQSITIIGNGIPNSSTDKTITLTINSASGSSTCNVTIYMIIASKKILHLGESSGYGYSAYLKASRNMLNASNNFGPYSNSLVKYEGFSNNAFHLFSSNTTPAELASLLAERPDIVIIGYAYTLDADEAILLANYINSKGVVIAFLEDSTSASNLAKIVFNDNTITSSNVNAAGSLYRIPTINDLIINGPFGDTRNGWWGEDASSTCRLTGASINTNATIYNTTVTQSSTTNTGVTFFKHNTKNFIWNGDGGFLSNSLENGTLVSTTICPFTTDPTTNFPITKTFGFPAPTQQVSNSILFANMMAWAIKQAETNGINN